MKKTRYLSPPGVLGPLAAVMLLTACAGRKDAYSPAAAPATAPANVAAKTNYVTAQDIATMTPRTAAFAKRLSEFSGAFRAADGKQFVLGDPAGDQWVWHFVGTLKIGQVCQLPDAFLNYQAAPYYVTGEEIAAMAPRAGTLAQRTPCSGYFTTADDKGFGIGDPGSGAQISHFLQSLERWETYQFPDAFLKFQKNEKPARP